MHRKYETNSLELKKINIDDRYWNRYTKLITDIVIPYQWDILNDKVPDALPSHCLENFKIVAGDSVGEHRGAIFQDSDASKWLEAVAYSLAQCPNPKLEETADMVISLMEKAQQEDGYLNTYYTLVEPDGRWKNLTAGHELYCAGHMFEAAVAYFTVTGKRKFLDISCRFADLIYKVFGPNEGQIKGYPGHPEIELALVRLYNVTENKKYLELSKFFIDSRGESPNYFLEEMKRPDYKNIYPEFSPYDPAYSQSHLPVREQDTAEGHAVRALYLYSAMADIANIYKDEELLKSCKNLWNNLVKKRMFITGSVGSSGFLERFTTDYDLPNDCNYSETCASIGLANFGIRMANITKDSSYIDVVERALYNTVRAGISLEGNRYFYVNPLEVWPDNCMDFTSRSHIKPVRQKWFDVACCPTNIARTFTSLGNYIYSKNEKELFLNLFVQNKAQFEIDNKEVNLNIISDYPRSGNIKLVIESDEANFDFLVRIPNYIKNYTFTLDGKKATGVLKNGYFCISNKWTINILEIFFEVKPEFIYPNPLVRANIGKVAVARGPEVYCFEEVDNGPNLSSIFLNTNTKPEENWNKDLLGGTMEITCSGFKLEDWEIDSSFSSNQKQTKGKVSLKAIPYGSWSNRKEGEMIVWTHFKD